jgi:hypothetical protein
MDVAGLPPYRKVTSLDASRCKSDVTYGLDCGHSVFIAGPKEFTLGDAVQCRTGPCYRFGRFMGKS